MDFKLLLNVDEVLLKDESTLEFTIEKPNQIRIELKNPPKEYIEKSTSKSLAFCEVFTTLEPPRNVTEILKKLSTIQSKKKGKNGHSLNENTSTVAEQDEIPQYFTDFVNQLHDSLFSPAKSVVGLIRWAFNFLGPHNPISSRGFFWSFDGLVWHQFPLKPAIFRTRYARTIHLNIKDQKKILNYLNNGVTEPIHHELFREAWSQRVSNPRSAIIIGAAAAEVGIKSTIAKQIPDSRWLMENIIAPPIDKILDQYLPILPVTNKINGKSIIPKPIIDTIKKIVAIRNKQVHVGLKPPDSKSIENMLEDVKDLLLLLDYYCGYDFSLSFISDKTKKVLRIT